jgi:hypothetical protein
VEAGGGTRLRKCIKSSCSEAKGVPARRSRGARPHDHSMEFTGYPGPLRDRISQLTPRITPKVPWSKRAPHNLQGALTPRNVIGIGIVEDPTLKRFFISEVPLYVHPSILGAVTSPSIGISHYIGFPTEFLSYTC